MKKHLHFISRTLLLAVFLLASVVAQAFDDGRYSFTVTKRATDSEPGEVTLYARKGETYSGVVSFPSVATDGDKWYNVTAIGDGVFQNNQDITELDMEDKLLKIKYLGSNCFAGCVSLKKILIHGGIETVGDGAFSGCSSLEDVKFGYGVVNLGSSNVTGVFQNCVSLKTVEIPYTVKYLGGNTFRGCTSLENVVLHDGLETIDYSAFYGCTRLTEFTIPNTVETVGGYSFSGCTNLKKVTIGTKVSKMGDYAFDGAISLEEVNIVEGCSIIGSFAFRNCTALKTVAIPGSVKTISRSAFQSCKALESVTLGEGVINIGSTSYSGDGVFVGCVSLKSIKFPSSVLYMNSNTFGGCTSLVNAELNEGLLQISSNGFYGCTSLESITIPNTVETVDSYSFSGCTNLKKVTIGSKVSKMGDYAFDGAVSLEELTIVDGCSIIGSFAFRNCTALKTVAIPGSVKTISRSAFQSCKALESVTLGEGVINIGSTSYSGDGVFAGCTQLSHIDIPSTVLNLYSNTFGGCTNLRRVTCRAATLPSLGTGTWSNSAQAKATLYVPESAVADYQASTQWNGFKNIWPIGRTGGEDMYGECDMVDVPSNSPYFDAVAFLCDRTVLSGSRVNGLVALGDDLLRGQLAKVAFRGLYLLDGIEYPTALASDYYPTCYQDINTLTADNEYYYQAARALLYLDYGDGVTPFDRNRLSFNPDGTIERIHVLKVLMETFDIHPDVSGTNNPFPNDPQAVHMLQNQPRKFGYLRKAVSLGIIDKATADAPAFNPYDKCTRGEAFLWLYRIMTNIEAGSKNFPKPVPTEEAYFEPLNMTLKTLALGMDVQMGNFNHYTKSSFAIGGVVPLTFAHSYDSYHTAIDDVFFGQRSLQNIDVTYRPLTAGWSHSYDCYVTLVGTGSGQRAIVHWGSGSIHVYKKSGTAWKPESLGVYDQLTIADGVATVKTKGQSTYRFELLEGEGSTLYYMTSVTDRNDNRLTVNYVDGQRGMKVVTSVSDGTRQLSFTYKEGTNLLAAVSDPLKRTIKFGYTYNKNTDEYQLTSFTDATGNVTKYAYGDNSKLSTARLLRRIQLPKGNYIENEYDKNRRLTQSVAGLNNVPKTKTSVSVLADYRLGSVATNSTVSVERESQTSTVSYEMNQYNVATRIRGDEDLESRLYYDHEGDADDSQQYLPTRIETNKSVVDDIKYDKRGNVLSVTVKGNDGMGQLTRTMTYDAMNNLTSVTDAKGNKTVYTYDERGNLTKVSAPEDVTTTFTVDSRGLTTRAVSPMGIVVEYAYNGFGNLTATSLPALSLSTSVEYDAASRATSVLDAMNRKTAYVYDNNDRLTAETDPTGKTTKYAYDANGNMTRITNAAGRYTDMTYDNVTDWLTSVAFGGSKKQYEYNKDGTLNTLVKADGTRLTCNYDKLGRLTFDGVNTYKYDSKMNLESIQSDKNKLTFYYDGFNRTTMVDFEQGSTQNTIRYEYDDNSNVTSVTYADGNEVKYTYDALNRMTSMTDWKGNTVSYTYRKDSKLSRVDYPNGMHTAYLYDNAGRLVGKETKIPGSAAAPGDLNQDDRVDVKDALLLADCIMGKQLDYMVYEAADLNQDEKIDVSDMVLETALITQGDQAQASGLHRALREAGYKDLASYAFTLDNVGNIVAQEAVEPFKAVYEPDQNVSYVYTNANRIARAGDVNFTFDLNGNTTKRGSDEMTWNQNDQLVYAEGQPIVYDPLGLIRSYGDTQYTVSVLGNGDVLSDSKTGNRYLYGQGLEARISPDGSVSYYVTDMRGSVIAIVDMDGNVTHRYQYDDFGRVVQSEEKDFNPFRYVGKYGVMYQTDTRYYMRARHYDPTIGRFLSEDPIWSTNLYPYCNNNPIMGIDPRGEADLELQRVFGDVPELTAGAGKAAVKPTSPTLTVQQQTQRMAEIAQRERLSRAVEYRELEKLDRMLENSNLDDEFQKQVNSTCYTVLPISFAISLYQGDVIGAYQGLWRDAYWTALGASATKVLGSGPAFMLTLTASELYEDVQAGKGYAAFSAEQYDAVFHHGGLLTRLVGYYGDGCQWAGQQLGKGILSLYHSFK